MSGIRFDATEHVYSRLDTGARVPNITSLLGVAGWIDDRWFTEESCDRGKAVHELTASYDLGALDVVDHASAYRGWLMAYVKLMGIIPHAWTTVEVPLARLDLNLAGRPDRLGEFNGGIGPTEIKSGPPAKGHPIQTALQAILAEPILKVPAEAQVRHAIYLTEKGRFKLESHDNPRDLREARRILRRYCS